MTRMHLWQDARFAIRLLAKHRWFTLAAATALALGIGANATVFTLVNAVLIRGVPFDGGDRLMALWTENAKGQRQGVSDEDFKDWREQSRSFSHLVAQLGATVNLADDVSVPERAQGTYISWDIFRMVGVQPVLGRDFREEDDRTGAPPVVILGSSIWRNRYGGASDVLGRTLRVNSKPATIIGVMPDGFQFPFNVDIWIPRAQLPPESFTGRSGRSFNVMGQLTTATSLAQARTELAGIGARLAQAYPDTNTGFRPGVESFNQSTSSGPIRTIFLTLMGAVGFVLLIACANVANLLLARSVGRSREIAIRVSQGATRWRIVRQLLVESVMLACLGGGVGLLLAAAGVDWFDRATQNVGKPYWMAFTFDPIVFAFVAAVCLGTGLLFGLAPALHVSKTDVNGVLKEGGRGTGGALRSRRWSAVLVVSELILTLVLLSGAGLLMRSFWSLYRLQLAISTTNLSVMQVYLPLTKYPQPGPRADLYQRFQDRMDGVAGIRASALVTSSPLSGGIGERLALDGKMPGEADQAPIVTVVAAGDRYFDTLQLPILRGRGFGRSDGLPGRGVAVVNERFAAVHLAGQDPIGHSLRLIGGTDQEWLSIVGVVPNVRQRDIERVEPDPVVYVPLRSEPQRVVALLVRGPASAANAATLARNEMRAVEPDIPLFQVESMDELLAQRRWQFLVFGGMFAVFAGIALLLSAMGLYAVTAHSVTERTQEIGVRMALGAQPRQVVWLVLRRALIQLAIGLPVGIAGALGVGKLLQAFLVQTSSRDPATLVSISIILIVVAVVACGWPARRAARLNPTIALRQE
jgi:putative ABC transport system permease protein